MNSRLMLDAGPLARLTHPRPSPGIVEWLLREENAGSLIMVPEIALYEVRRELVRAGLAKSVERLDALGSALKYWPLNTAAIRRASELWAKARNLGKPACDPKELDCDVILAAQAEQAGAEVVTENVGHLSFFVRVRQWQ